MNAATLPSRAVLGQGPLEPGYRRVRLMPPAATEASRGR